MKNARECVNVIVKASTQSHLIGGQIENAIQMDVVIDWQR